jgi:hypothetical protein
VAVETQAAAAPSSPHAETSSPVFAPLIASPKGVSATVESYMLQNGMTWLQPCSPLIGAAVFSEGAPTPEDNHHFRRRSFSSLSSDLTSSNINFPCAAGPPQSESLCHLEYRLALLAAKAEWKAPCATVPSISLFNHDAYEYQGVPQDQIVKPPHPDAYLPLEHSLLQGSVLRFMQSLQVAPDEKVHLNASGVSSPAGVESPLMGTSLLCSLTASAIGSPRSECSPSHLQHDRMMHSCYPSSPFTQPEAMRLGTTLRTGSPSPAPSVAGGDLVNQQSRLRDSSPVKEASVMWLSASQAGRK